MRSLRRGMGISIKGQDAVIKNLNKEIRGVKNRTRKGMAAAALIVKAESMDRVPVDDSFLKNEHDTDVFETPQGVRAIIHTGGLVSRPYAVVQHENLDFRHTVGQARFLATALIIKAKEVFAVIAGTARID